MAVPEATAEFQPVVSADDNHLTIENDAITDDSDHLHRVFRLHHDSGDHFLNDNRMNNDM